MTGDHMDMDRYLRMVDLCQKVIETHGGDDGGPTVAGHFLGELKRELFPGDMYATLIENCDWEGETWRFYIQIDGNEAALAELETALAPFAEKEPVAFELDLTPVPEFEVDVLVKHDGDTTYMKAHTKLSGTLRLSEKALTMLADGENDPLYKGGIAGWVK